MSSLFPLEPLGAKEELQMLYDRLAARFGFGAAVVRLSRRKLTGGHIFYGSPHRITVSAHLSAAERDNTLRHEAAHAWAYLLGKNCGHGALFRRLARNLGASFAKAPDTKALEEFRKKREVIYRCEGCARLFPRFRPFRGARFCIACDRAGRPARLRRLRAPLPPRQT
ncbi:MAG: SprT-like domain-containing protein [Thermoanaerobaculia bacterium]